MSATAATASVEAALAHGMRMLERDPQLAAEQAREILSVAPGHPVAGLLLGMACNLAGAFDQALAVLLPLARSQPKAAKV